MKLLILLSLLFVVSQARLGDGVRRNVCDLAATQEGRDELQLLVDAFGQLAQDTHASGWSKWRMYDRVHQGTTAHGNSEFLPWHRAFLHMLELEIREIDPRLSLPYWDFNSDNPTCNGLLSGASWSYGTVSGAPNGHAFRNLGQTFFRAIPSFGRPNGNRNAISSNSYTTMNSNVENANHNAVHVWVGGDMGSVGTAAEDPLFFLLHANVDRNYAQWQWRNPNTRIRSGSAVYGGAARTNGGPWPYSCSVGNRIAPYTGSGCIDINYASDEIVYPRCYDTNTDYDRSLGTCTESYLGPNYVPPCSSDEECDDGNPCNGAEVCGTVGCESSPAPPSGTECTQDDSFCNGIEICMMGSCVSPGNPCEGETEVCDEEADDGSCVDLCGPELNPCEVLGEECRERECFVDNGQALCRIINADDGADCFPADGLGSVCKNGLCADCAFDSDCGGTTCMVSTCSEVGECVDAPLCGDEFTCIEDECFDACEADTILGLGGCSQDEDPCLAEAGHCTGLTAQGELICSFASDNDGEICDQDTGEEGVCLDSNCVECGVDMDCDDDDFCTQDRCENNRCVFLATCTQFEECDADEEVCRGPCEGLDCNNPNSEACESSPGRCVATSATEAECVYDIAPDASLCGDQGFCLEGTCSECALDVHCASTFCEPTACGDDGTCQELAPPCEDGETCLEDTAECKVACQVDEDCPQTTDCDLESCVEGFCETAVPDCSAVECDDGAEPLTCNEDGETCACPVEVNLSDPIWREAEPFIYYIRRDLGQWWWANFQNDEILPPWRGPYCLGGFEDPAPANNFCANVAG